MIGSDFELIICRTCGQRFLLMIDLLAHESRAHRSRRQSKPGRRARVNDVRAAGGASGVDGAE